MAAEGRASPIDRARIALATGLGTGFAPFAPGTVGSVPGVLLYWAAWTLGGSPAAVAALVVVTVAGTWASDFAEAHFRAKDPGQVTVDEIAGQLLALLFVPPTPLRLLTGFVLFRAADVVKPFPARRFERLPGGAGIMADDLVAGLYANLALQAAVRFLPGFLGAA